MEIKDLRCQIDAIDDELTRLFVKRMNLSKQVADYKKENNLPIYIPEREQEILQKVDQMSGAALADYTRELYTKIFELSREYQHKQNKDEAQIDHTGIDSIHRKHIGDLLRCGLLGKKLGHSYSPQIHSRLGNYTYELFEKSPEELGEFFANEDFSGINVTIPYKKDVIPYCDELTDYATKLGAVNTIVRRSDNSLVGHNTDFFGFQSMVSRSGLSVSGKKVLVLGSGGACATVTAVLRDLAANVTVISRSGENNYNNLSNHKDASLIVNTTPVGMYPDTGTTLVDLSQFPCLEGVFDVVYNPSKTKLLLDAEKRGLVTENGLWMLVAQAKESAEWFTGKSISNEVIADIHTILRKQMENVILIGMPGCGKTTVGRIIAQVLGKTFIDADEEIVKMAGCTIPEIFSQQGEEQFRQYETAVLKELGRQSGLIIATGGGCVTRPENYEYLHQNGCIVWIKRDISVLPTEGRPLSQQNKLEEMYRMRKSMYQTFADHIVSNDGDLQETIQNILKKVGY